MHPYTRVNEKERLTRQLSGSIITQTFVKKKKSGKREKIAISLQENIGQGKMKGEKK